MTGRSMVSTCEVIQKFFRDLPDHVPPVEVEKAEKLAWPSMR